MLGSNNFGEGSLTYLGNVLSNNNTLKCLHLNEELGQSCWRGFSQCLTSPYSALEELSLGSCELNDDSTISLFTALGHNKSLKRLRIVETASITAAGWTRCFQLLIGSESILEELDFSETDIDDRGARSLVTLLSRHMRTVLSLRVFNQSSMTKDGWLSFTRLLHPSSTSHLKTLTLGYSWEEDNAEMFIDDDVFICFARALQSNTSLKELEFGVVEVALRSFDALEHSLCDVTSIESVCHSNHTLIDFSCMSDLAHPSVRAVIALLQFNKNENKSEVVRTKLLLPFFFSDFDAVSHIFGHMPTSELPHAISWMGKDGYGFNPLYLLCQNLPWLFDVQK